MGVGVDYISAFFLFVAGFGLAIMAGRSIRLRWWGDRKGSFPISGGVARLDSIGPREDSQSAQASSKTADGARDSGKEPESVVEPEARKATSKKLRAQRRK
jgi:hypothetical protein